MENKKQLAVLFTVAVVLLCLCACERTALPTLTPIVTAELEPIIEPLPTPEIAEPPAHSEPSADPDILFSNGFSYRVNEDGTATIVDSRKACSEIESLIVPESIDGHTITAIGKYAFEDCYLSSIELPDTLITIEYKAFFKCHSLREIIIPDSVTTIGTSAFCESYHLEKVHLPDNLVFLGEAAFSMCGALTEINIPESLTQISEGTFSHCEALQTMILPDGITYIGDDAFLFCNSLHTVHLPNALQYIGASAFSSCPAISEIDIPESVSFLGDSAFFGCGIESVYIPKEIKKIGDNPFARNAVREIIVSEDNSCYASIDGVLFNKDGTELICYPAGIETDAYTVPQGTVSIEAEAFFGSGVKKVCLPKSVKYVNNEAFGYCTELETIYIPASVIWIDECAFNDWISNRNEDVTLMVESYSYAKDYADKYQFRYETVTFWDSETGNYTVHCSDGDVVKD